MRELDQPKFFFSPEQILRVTNARAIELKEISDKAKEDGDINTQCTVLAQRAEMIVNLYERVASTVARPEGDTFPGGELRYLEGLSFIAQSALRKDDKGDSSDLSSVLTNVNARPKEPNHLEQVIRRVYSKKAK